MDRLGELCSAGRNDAASPWQVPHDAEARRKIAAALAEIKVEAAKQGRREMGRIVDELEGTLREPPSPQDAEVVQTGFERLTRPWQAAKSRIF